MPLADQLRALERDRDTLLDRMESLVTQAEAQERGLTPEEVKTRDELKTQVDSIVLRHTTVAEALEYQKQRTVNAQRPENPGAATDPTNPAVGAPLPRFDTPRQPVPGKMLPGIKFARYAAAIGASKGNLMQALEISKRWRVDSPEIEQILRAAITVGSTTDPAWAGSLIAYRQMAEEFIGLLTPQTIVGQLPLRRVPFLVRIPRALTGATAQWVGEGKAKPVSKGSLDTIQVPQHKLAVIAVLTQELVRFSDPSAEVMTRDMLIQAISDAMNAAFIDPASAAVVNVKPASVTNGVAAIAGSPFLGTAPLIRTAGLTMVGNMMTANYPLASLRWIMNPALLMYMVGLRTAQDMPAFPELAQGNFLGIPFVTSTTVPVTAGPPISSPLVLVDCNSILLADDGQVTIDMSREASVEMSDNPESEAGTVVSLWQSNLVGILAERFITWVKGRAGNVQLAQITHAPA